MPAKTIYDRMHTAYKRAGLRGLTINEFETATGVLHQSTATAHLALREESIIVQKHDRGGAVVTRKTTHGRAATVWMLRAAGKVTS